MKKKLIFLFFVTILTACDKIHIGTHKDTIATFTFVDANGKDIFADSLTVNDFQITSTEGYASLVLVDTIYGKYHFDISFGEGNDGDEKSVTLFHLKNDIDTVVVTFKDNYYSIQDLYYNGEKIKFESDLDRYCTIIK